MASDPGRAGRSVRLEGGARSRWRARRTPASAATPRDFTSGRRGRRPRAGGPPIWIGNDCQHGNPGPIASGSGEVETRIRDLERAVIGNRLHDLIRLGRSLTTAA